MGTKKTRKPRTTATKKTTTRKTKKSTAKAGAKGRLVFIESDDDEATIRKKLGKKKIEIVDLWVRKADNEQLSRLVPAARLCRCRSVCLAVIEDMVADPMIEG